MRRRGNKSHKVPNVKLRPPEKGSITRPAVESCWAEDTQPPNDSSSFLDPCPRPFKGLEICATGISDKPALFKQAVELGAVCLLAFTDRVTHLVADTHGGAKYSCAVERKIPIVKPSFITENYKMWLKGDDVDWRETLDDHRLPIFSGVTVCPSGITDITRRTQISKLIAFHEGTYLTKLERPVKVTHLLCSGDELTDKMRLAEKFNSRGEAKIHLVWEEWFWDSMNFGGRFDEATYQVTRPRPERKVLPEDATPPPPSSDVGSQYDQAFSSSAPRPPQPPRPPQNAPSAEDLDDEPAFANVLPNVTLQLWKALLDKRGYQEVNGEVILSPSKLKKESSSVRDLPTRRHVPLPDSPVRAEIAEGGSVLSAFRRTNSFAPVVQPTAGPSSTRHLPFRRSTNTAGAFAGNAKAGPSTARLAESTPPPAANGGDNVEPPPPPSQIFAGMAFRMLGEAKSPNVRTAIEQLGGRVSTDEDEDVTFVIVRLVSGSKLFRQDDDEELKRKYRTECWLEHCIYEDRICEPEEQIAFLPLSIPLPVFGADRVIFSLSGFDQSESCSLKRLLRALGITLASTFSRRSTHLLCPSGKGLKFDKAKEWHVPVVGMGWLEAMARTGKVPAVVEFLVEGSYVPPDEEGEERMEMEVEVPKKVVKGKGKAVDKGKGKAKAMDLESKNAMDVDVDVMMQDITNNTPPDVPAEGPPLKKSRSTTAALERQPTTIINPEPPEARDTKTSTSMFGLPNETLGGVGTTSSYWEEQQKYSSLPQTSTSSPARSMAVAQDHEKMKEESFTMPSQGLGPAALSVNTRPQTPQREPTLLNFEEQNPDQSLDDFRIPSSKSPSPMKAPPLQKAGSSRLSLSPVKVDFEATKALQESITSLLGKRPSPEGDELVMGVGESAADVVGADEGLESHGAEVLHGGRGGKRARPQRTKAQSRQLSEARIKQKSKAKPSPTRPRTRASKSSALIASTSAVAATVATSTVPHPGFADSSMHPFSSYTVDDAKVSDNVESQAESIRILYEDPAQTDEKKRLMNLLKGKGQGSQKGVALAGVAASVGVGISVTGSLGGGEPETLSSQSSSSLSVRRRSTRIAGF